MGRTSLKLPPWHASLPQKLRPPTARGAGPGASAKPNEPSRLAGGEPAKLHLIVPAYFYPSGLGMKAWQRLMDASSKVPIVVVANPSSGPGDLLDQEYAAVIDVASDKGLRSLATSTPSTVRSQ